MVNVQIGGTHMHKNVTVDAYKKVPEYPRIDPNTITLIQAFAANTNNHLMNLSVSGDDILKSAKLMQDAHEIIKLLSEME